jgi:hypothetical protein
MNNLVYLFIGFMLGIVTCIILKMLCTNKNSRRNRGNMIVPRRTIQITSEPIYLDTESDINYSVSIDEEEHIRVVETV